MLLEVCDLCVDFGSLRAADAVSFSVAAGRVVGLVGESGSGKSATAAALLRLHDPGRSRVTGSVKLEGQDLLALAPAEMRRVRGARVAMIFQDPGASLNPALTIAQHLIETIRVHRPEENARAKALSLLMQVGIPDPSRRLESYPHQLSGGMRQRVMIALALSCDPEVIIADEPTTALDVTIQAQIVELLVKLVRERKMGLLLITHDLGLVAETCDDVVVLYAGRVVERGATKDVLARPRHPYTAGLLASRPMPGGGKLVGIPGVVPDLRSLPPGCRFQDRCSYAQEKCRSAEPALDFDDSRAWRCVVPLS